MVELENILKRNSFPHKIISKEIRKYLNGKFSKTKIKTEKESNSKYYKLPYIGKFSKCTKENILDISQTLYRFRYKNKFFSFQNWLPFFSER